MPEQKNSVPRQTVNILNDDALKGIYADGLGFHINNNVVILEAVITKPRVDVPTIATRIIFPRAALESIIESLSKALELQKAKEKKASEEKTKAGK